MTRRRPTGRGSAGRGSGGRGATGGGGRDYPRTLRVNQLLREIIAEQLEVIDDDRLVTVAITAVETDRELARATVFFDSLEGVEGDAQVLAAFDEIRYKLQGAIGREARIRNTPKLSFEPDLGVRAGARIEELLSTVEIREGDVPVPDAEDPVAANDDLAPGSDDLASGAEDDSAGDA